MLRRPLRIAMVAACPFPAPRGTPIRIERMSRALAQRGHDVHVVTYHLGDGPEEGGYRIHRSPRVATYRRTAAGPSYQKLLILDPLLVLTLRRVLRDRRIDVIHAHHCEGLLVARLARLRGPPPVVFDAHTLLESELPYYGLGLSSRLKSVVGRSLDRHLPPRADHVIAVTDDIRNRMVGSGSMDPGRVSVIPNGVELEIFDLPAPTPPPAGATRNVIFTGNMAAYQGIDLMLDAFRILRELRDDVRLSIVTEEDFAPYAARAEALGIRGFIDLHRTDFSRVPALLAASEVALNPRIHCDGLPQKLLNYMASGKPVVSFAGSAKHLVDGAHGRVVADGDIGAFARAVDELLRDRELSARMAVATRDFARRTFSWDAAAGRIESVYEALL